MKLRFLIAFFTIYLTASYSQQKFDFKKLETKLKDLQKATNTVGFSVAIIQGDKIIFAKGFGYRDLKNKIKADENTLYPIGSTSKAFTVGLLGLMEDEKGLKFDDSPKKYIPSLNFYNEEMTTKITILDMISHRTGLPRHDISWYLFPTNDKQELVSRIQYQEPFTGIRKQWHYNNFMYLAQGLITEKLTGKSWEENIKERFFKPLQMYSSTINIQDLQTYKNIAIGYSLENFTTNKELPYYDIAAISPAGSINSSVMEMANWVKIWINEGKFNNVQVLPKKYINKATNPLMLVGNGIDDKKFPDQHLNSYGYAWFTSSYKGHYRLEHGGNIDGFSANVSFFPTDNLGIVVLTNQDGSSLPTLARNTISDEILNLEKTDWKTYYLERLTKAIEQQKNVKKQQESSKISTTKPSHNLAAYTGNYSHPGYGNFKIESQKDSLWAQFTRERYYVDHLHYDVFKLYPIVDGKIDTTKDLGFNFNFIANELGDIASANIKFEPTLAPLTFKRSPIEAVINTAVLNSYIGKYKLQGTSISIYLKDDSLRMLVPGQPEYTLTAITENEFIIKGLTGYKARFDKKENQLHLVLLQPNGTFTAIKDKI